MSIPHDSLAQWTFSQLEYARSELALLLPPGIVEKLDFSSLEVESGSRVDQHLEQSYSDLLYSVELAGQPAFIYVLFEHQSTVDELMPLRLLKYMVLVWDQHCRDCPDAKRLPPIIPLVLHHSASGWTKATSFHELVGPPLGDLPELARLVPDFHFLLDDISHQSNRVLLDRPQPAAVLAMLWALRDARTAGRMLKNFDAFRAVLVAMSGGPAGSEAMHPWMSYIVKVVDKPTADEIKRRVIETVGEVAEKVMATIAEELMQKGEAKGRQEGRRALLFKQLRIRFGDVPARVVARVDAATAEELDLWAERILTASSPDAVVDG
jgi:hypothetical protein